MHAQQLKVREFQVNVRQETHTLPTVPGPITRRMHIDLINTAAHDVIAAIDEPEDPGSTQSFAELAEELVDLLYVTLSAANAYGINLYHIFPIVHHANMKKIGGPRRSDGKQLVSLRRRGEIATETHHDIMEEILFQLSHREDTHIA